MSGSPSMAAVAGCTHYWVRGGHAHKPRVTLEDTRFPEGGFMRVMNSLWLHCGVGSAGLVFHHVVCHACVRACSCLELHCHQRVWCREGGHECYPPTSHQSTTTTLSDIRSVLSQALRGASSNSIVQTVEGMREAGNSAEMAARLSIECSAGEDASVCSFHGGCGDISSHGDCGGLD